MHSRQPIPYSQRIVRGLWTRWLRRNSALLMFVFGGALVILALFTWVVLKLAGPSGLGLYLLGAVHVAAIGSLLHALRVLFIAHQREAVYQIRGTLGEQATRDELAHARRRRLVWTHLNSLTLQIGDIDHIAFTRQAGIVVIDSKWRTAITSTDREAMAASARRARTRTIGLIRTVTPAPLQTSPDHQARRTPPVKSIVVIWGPAQHDMPDEFTDSDVTFVAGRCLRAWLRAQHGQPMTRHDARGLRDRLSAHQRSISARGRPAGVVSRPKKASAQSGPVAGGQAVM